MKISIWSLGKIQKGLVWGYSNRAKSIILGRVSEIFEIFRGKGTLDHPSRKFYILNILPTHQCGQLCLARLFASFAPFRK
jgi:hypothetical protein